ncbi:glycosyltransferase [Chelatococcus sp. SYSU_G07232]|uniref:Glycosyltransferase n=1 Tax=Chelatococcus albus TaxID=3047466 RepID=A0ABT7ACI1_9HYPH|nr:glycosyltransferase [Chelatococcus sp. SYSU_G07232]MDJ1157077.1 glycosyltransferase [Chelatococcus sp. SYSU_G07232]
MKLVVIIPTLGRGNILRKTLAHLEHQRRLPDEVIVSAPDETHVEPQTFTRLRVSHVFGATGLCAQRNRALSCVLPRFDIITFFDDDFLPAHDYLQKVVTEFAGNPDWAVVMGRVVADGARTQGLSFEEGLAALRRAEDGCPPEREIVDHPGAYGCNMSIRAAQIGDLRFDERLVLYGWQEDIDFTGQLRRRGRVVAVSTLIGVHLGLKTGKGSGLRLGYSQVVNPIYLMRKGTMGMGFGLELMSRNIAANILRSLRPEPYVDRRGRLRGNLLGLYHVARGRIEPEHILQL